jgi:D-serine deaminase-like pyridoxal phosphate-dependent protein
MNRRQFLVVAAGAAVAAALAFKPSDGGASYAPYFNALNEELKRSGPYKPVLLVDLDKLDQNLRALTNGLRDRLAYRVVAKSLPSPKLLGYIMQAARTEKLMVFHQPFIRHIAERFPRADLLVGKPLPAKGADNFYAGFTNTSGFDPARQIQWLIDTKARLDQYQAIAHKMNTKLRINIEIDVGLHRGGLQAPAEMIPIVEQILADPEHLELAGFMGYDVHAVKIPGIIKSQANAYAQSQADYQNFLDLLKSRYPQIDADRLCLNGAGSPTLNLHKQKTLINDLAAGSCLVKPTEFDLPTLQEYMPAAYIATPVLKRLRGTTIPAIESFKGLLSWWNPNMAQTFFIYGGKWMAHYESPGGLRDNGFYGPSTNQHMVNGSGKIDLDVDDHVFLRPSQSEFVFLQFGDLLAVRDGRIVEQWPILKE